MELEAEPWTTAGIPNTPIDQQFKTMSLDHFSTILAYARGTGLARSICGRGMVVLDEAKQPSGILGKSKKHYLTINFYLISISFQFISFWVLKYYRNMWK